MPLFVILSSSFLIILFFIAVGDDMIDIGEVDFVADIPLVVSGAGDDEEPSSSSINVLLLLESFEKGRPLSPPAAEDLTISSLLPSISRSTEDDLDEGGGGGV